MSRGDFEKLIDPNNPESAEETIEKLKLMILQQGLPDEEAVCYYNVYT
jgi:hypothetical protein